MIKQNKNYKKIYHHFLKLACVILTFQPHRLGVKKIKLKLII